MGVAHTVKTASRSIMRAGYPLLAGLAMAVLTILLWQFAERQQRENIDDQVRAITKGLVQTIESTYEGHAEAVARMAERWEKSGGTSFEVWTFDAANYKRDIPGFKFFTWIDGTYTTQWLMIDGQIAEPSVEGSPVQRSPSSLAFLTQLRSDDRRSGTYFYTSRFGERMLLLQAPMSSDGEFLGFVGGAIDITDYMQGVHAIYDDDLLIRVHYDGESIFQSRDDIPPLDARFTVTQSVQMGDSKFLIEAHPNQALIDTAKSSLPFLVLCVGFTWTLIVAWLIHQSSVIKQKSLLVERQSLALNQTSDAMFIHNPRQGILDCNDAAIKLFGYSRSEFIGMHTRELAADIESLQSLYADRDEMLAAHGRWTVTLKCRTKSGDIRIMSIADSELKDAQGNTVGFVSMARDVTEQEEINARVIASETKFRSLFESGRDGIAIRPVKREGVKGIADVNQAYLELTGYTLQELNSLPDEELVPFEGQEEIALRARQQLEERGYADTFTTQYRRKDGTYRQVETCLWRTCDEAGRHIQTIELARDVTDQEANRAKIIESENKFRSLFESSRDAIIIRSAKGKDVGQVIDANQAYQDLVGYCLDEIPVYTANNMMMSPESYAVMTPYLRQLDERGYTNPFDVEFLRKNGTKVPANVQLWRTYDDDGKHVQTITIARDTSDAIRVEEGLKEAQHIAQMGSWEFDLTRKVGSWSQEMYRIFEVEAPDRPLGYEGLLEVLHPDDRDKFADDRERADKENIPINDVYRIVMTDGRIKYLRFNFRTVLDQDGAVIKRLGTAQDITSIRELEEALRHTQKLQTVGQLTAGIAHDFNNILGVISSNAQYLEMVVEDNPDVSVTVERVVRAVKRGAKLTDQMLSFSRKQALAPSQIEPAAFLDELIETISRSLGEEVAIEVDMPDAPWRVMADETQLANAILNLSLNGRDALSGSGCLNIAVRNVIVDPEKDQPTLRVEAGSYVAISVTDNGTGMSKEIQEQVFEPFFTTKEVGAGSGLGLSMVYGFTEQSGGTTTLESEVGEGTTVTMYLPATNQQGELVLEKLKQDTSAPQQTRTILLVEDQPDLRAINEKVLQKLGHRVVTAEDAHTALQAASQIEHIDAAFLDIVLPGGMDGVELASRLRATRPSLKVLFTTGYAARDVLDEIDHVDHDGLFRKPIQIHDVSVRLDDIFGSQNRSASISGKQISA